MKLLKVVFVIGVLAIVTQNIVFCADIIVDSCTKANLAAAGTAGRLYRITDDIRGLWMDNGTNWFPLFGDAALIVGGKVTTNVRLGQVAIQGPGVTDQDFTSAIASDSALTVTANTTGSYAANICQFGGPTTASDGFYVQTGTELHTSGNSTFSFFSGGGTRAVLVGLNDGSIGSGTESPDSKLHIVGEDTTGDGTGPTHASIRLTRSLQEQRGMVIHYDPTNNRGRIATYDFDGYAYLPFSLDTSEVRLLDPSQTGTNAKVGILTTTPNSTVHNNGSQAYRVLATISAYTAASNDNILTANSAGGAYTISLPTAASITGRVYTIKRINSGTNKNVTIDPYGAETIGGSSTYVLSAQWKYVKVISDGANWLIIGKN